MKHWVMWGVAALLVMSGCDDGGGGDSDDPGTGGGEVASELAAYSGAAQRAHAAAIDVVRVATSDFTVELDEVDPDVAEFDAALERALAAHAEWVAAGWTLMGEPSASEAREDALFVPFGVALAGLAFTAVSGYIGLSKVTAARVGPVIERIEEANDETLVVINRELGLPLDTSSEDAVEAFEELGPGDRLAIAALIENAITNAVDDNVDGVDPIEESDRRAGIGEAAELAGETAIKTTVSAFAVATGGEGIVEVGRLLGASRGVAIGVDLALSAAGAVGGSTTPLNALGNHLTVAIQSQETSDLEVPPSPGGEPEDAAEIARSDAAPGARDEAVATLSAAMADAAPDALSPESNDEGGVTVQAADLVHLTHLAEPGDAETFRAAPAGVADVLVVGERAAPQVVEDVDTDEDGSISIAAPSEDDDGGGGDDPSPEGLAEDLPGTYDVAVTYTSVRISAQAEMFLASDPYEEGEMRTTTWTVEATGGNTFSIDLNDGASEVGATLSGTTLTLSGTADDGGIQTAVITGSLSWDGEQWTGSTTAVTTVDGRSEGGPLLSDAVTLESAIVMTPQ